MQRLSRIPKKRLSQTAALCLVVLLIALIGAIVLMRSHAATPFVSAEPEAGSISSPATKLSDTTASAGSAVKFTTSGGGTTSCPLPAYPSASCTGVPSGTTLTAYTGPSSISTPNTVITGKTITGCIQITAPGVIIRNSRVTCASGYAIDSYNYTGTPLLIEDSEINCGASNATGIGESNLTARRLNIHDCENGFDVNGDMLIEDNYIHDLFNQNGAHSDDIQLTNNAKNVTIRHNTLYTNDTSAVISPPVERGIVENILITQNLMAGGTYTLYCEQNGKGINYRVIDNHFSRIFHPNVGQYAPWTDCTDETQVTGNVYHETGSPL